MKRHFTASASDAVKRRIGAVVLILSAAASLGGCAIVSAIDTTASLAIGTVGLVANTTIGVATITGKAIGAVAGAVIPGDE